MKLEIDTKELQLLTRFFGFYNEKALKWAVTRESYRLHTEIRKYARRWGNKQWGPFAPITKALRKGARWGKGVGPWVASFVRYHVQNEPDGITAHIGMLSRADKSLKNMRFEGISPQFASSYERLARGYSFFQTRKAQRKMYAALKERGYLGYVASAGTPYGRNKRYLNRYLIPVPRVGWHRVKARPFIEPVVTKEKSRTIRNIKRLYKDKLAGVNTKGWIKKWGNK